MKDRILAVVLAAAVVLAGTIIFMRTASPEGEAIPAFSSAPPISPEAAIKLRAAEILSGMTPEEKAWQLLVVRPEAISGENVAVRPEAISAAVKERPAGGIVLFSGNLVNAEQAASLISGAQGESKLGMFIAVDEEGGAVARVAEKLGTTALEPMYSYRHDGEAKAFENARTIAADISRFGFNLNFAPVADVWSNPLNTVIGTRAYSDDPAEAGGLVKAALRGFSENGVIPVLKHFPGHGGTKEDSHAGAVYSDRTADELMEFEMKPFIAGIEAGADMVMIGHITLRAIDPDAPATFSREIVGGLLRDKLGFGGVVITDGLEMGAVSGYTPADAAVLAIEAGCDILLAPTDADAAVSAIMERVPESRIDESVLRILALKLKYGII